MRNQSHFDFTNWDGPKCIIYILREFSSLNLLPNTKFHLMCMETLRFLQLHLVYITYISASVAVHDRQNKTKEL